MGDTKQNEALERRVDGLMQQNAKLKTRLTVALTLAVLGVLSPLVSMIGVLPAKFRTVTTHDIAMVDPAGNPRGGWHVEDGYSSMEVGTSNGGSIYMEATTEKIGGNALLQVWTAPGNDRAIAEMSASREKGGEVSALRGPQSSMLTSRAAEALLLRADATRAISANLSSTPVLSARDGDTTHAFAYGDALPSADKK
jgi:hypothetical protein